MLHIATHHTIWQVEPSSTGHSHFKSYAMHQNHCVRAIAYENVLYLVQNISIVIYSLLTRSVYSMVLPTAWYKYKRTRTLSFYMSNSIIILKNKLYNYATCGSMINSSLQHTITGNMRGRGDGLIEKWLSYTVRNIGYAYWILAAI